MVAGGGMCMVVLHRRQWMHQNRLNGFFKNPRKSRFDSQIEGWEGSENFFFFLTFPTHLAFDVQSGLGITFHSHHVPSSSDCKQESSYIRPNEYLMEWGV